MTELAAGDGAARRAPKRGKAHKAADDVVTANGLATHLGMTRQNVARLTAEAVIEQRHDGRYDQTASRLRYIKHLRAEHRQSARSQADAEHVAAKTEMLKLRLLEKRRDLVPREEFDGMIDSLAGLVLTKLHGLPARVGGPDLAVRRKAEAVVIELRRELSEAATRMADAAGKVATAEQS
jgi:hypothetical protein